MPKHECEGVIHEISGIIEKAFNTWYWYHPGATYGVGIKYCPWCGEELK